MITVEQAYERYLLKTQKNATNDGAATSRDIFCLLFNESQNKYLSITLQQRGVDDVRNIQKFLILDEKVEPTSEDFNKCNFPLPEKYFDLADVRAIATKDSCSDLINLFEVQTENLNEIIQDEYNKPSFEWRESFYTINSDNLSVYVDNFKISEILLNYYRYPNRIESINESSFNESKVIEWDEQSLDIIISITAGESDLNQNNPRFQLQNARAKQ
jgi:hypothetical protein